MKVILIVLGPFINFAAILLLFLKKKYLKIERMQEHKNIVHSVYKFANVNRQIR